MGQDCLNAFCFLSGPMPLGELKNPRRSESRCVSQVYSFQGHLNSYFSYAVKKYLTQELQEEFVLTFEAVWSYEKVGGRSLRQLV